MSGGGMVNRAHVLLFLHVSGEKNPRKNLRFIVVQSTHFRFFFNALCADNAQYGREIDLLGNADCSFSPQHSVQVGLYTV
jgi:hypothetical protein